MPNKPFLGVCYYPEHWPEARWHEDAAKMSALGIRQVRIGEFAWSRIEPEPGRFEWGWLDRAIDTLGDAGLEVMLGTPTATPPKWLIDAHPDILAYDENGQPRRFGSRRHYCFSSDTYHRETKRIVDAVAKRYGNHKAVTAWQTDNEYGCHDTIRSYSPAAEKAFRIWLQNRYGDVEQLNEAWGCVFWSQEYRSFSEVDLPNMTVTEPNPSHVLDFYRFSSDQVIAYNRLQTDIIRKYSPDRTITHNFMGFFFSFDHFAVAEDIDTAGWDSYPIGFLDVAPFPPDDKERYMRQGHPDIAAFHHDLYRAVGRGRWRILEQQPGPVNWAPNNPEPLAGMVRLWSLEGIAHGAESVNYFRWRQAPFAQEQMHAGLERPDGQPAAGYQEAAQVFDELSKLPDSAVTEQADAAIIFSYDAHWLFEAQPQGGEWRYSSIVFQWYAALRRFGLNVDFVKPGAALDGYKLVIAPSLPILDKATLSAINNAAGVVLVGPRTGSKTRSLNIPDNLPPGALQALMPIKVTKVESLPAFYKIGGTFKGAPIGGHAWLDHIETDLVPLADSDEGGLLYRNNNLFYLATNPDPAFLATIIATLIEAAGVHATLLPQDLRLRRCGDTAFLFNYGPEEVDVPASIAPADNRYLIGGLTLPPAGVAAWKI